MLNRRYPAPVRRAYPRELTLDQPPSDFPLAITRFCKRRLAKLLQPRDLSRLRSYLIATWESHDDLPRRSRGYDWAELARLADIPRADLSAVRSAVVPLLAAFDRADAYRSQSLNLASAPRRGPGRPKRPVDPSPQPLSEAACEATSFEDVLDFQIRRHGETAWQLHAAIVQPGDLLSKTTIPSWRRGTKTPQTIEAYEWLRRIEERYQLPAGYFRSFLADRPRATRGNLPGLTMAESRRLAWHLPDDFCDRTAVEQAEILDWVRSVIIYGTTDYRRYHAQISKHRFGLRFEAGKSDEFLAPARLRSEMADLNSFKTSTLTKAGFRRSGVWNGETSAQRTEHLALMFGAFAAAPDGPVGGLGVPRDHLTFGMLIFPAIWDWYVQWRERRRGFYTRWESEMLHIAAAFTRAETGWLRQSPEYAERLLPIAGLVTGSDVAEAQGDWPAACDRLYAHGLARAKEVERVARVHRDPFEPILPVLEADSPLAEYRKIADELVRRMPDAKRYPKANAESVRAFLMLRIGLHTGLRQKNLRQLMLCPKGQNPRTERQLVDTKRGEIRWSEREAGWEIFIPAVAFKNATSSFFGSRPFRLVLPDLGGLYDYIDFYIERGRALLLRTAADPGTFFVKSVKTSSRDASYNQHSFYEAWRLTIQRYGIYNPYTGLGAIKGLLPHGPHNVRDVLATHILKQTGSYEQASYAIQDTPEMVAQHYGRFLPQDKAALAAQVLNQVWEAA